MGFAQSGSTRNKDDTPAARPDELWSLYVLSVQHGTGIGALLLNAVLLPDLPAELWVAEANPRARRFYEKHGFVSDGARFTDDLEIAEIRMARGV